MVGENVLLLQYGDGVVQKRCWGEI